MQSEIKSGRISAMYNVGLEGDSGPIAVTVIAATEAEATRRACDIEGALYPHAVLEVEAA